jgi:GPH family glycoside/pentoside/hexuronide:cation symporter
MTASAGWRYGLLGLPLAFVALPLYVQLPNHYAREFGVPLAPLGAVLLASRLFDACLDPAIGRAADRLFARSARAVLAVGAGAAAVIAAGFALLFLPPGLGVPALLAWAAVLLAVTYVAFSTLSIAHQTWGALLGGSESEQARIVGWREGLGLVGVLLALVLPLLAGWPATALLLAAALAAGWAAWTRVRRPVLTPVGANGSWREPLGRPAFRRLVAVFVLNGIATATPATLVLFFVQDRLQATPAMEPLFLAAYFLSGALSIPLWTRLVDRFGLARSWLAGMLLAVVAFSGAALLGAGDVAGFLVVCVLSGLALGSDLAIPGALLARLVASEGANGGVYFGWWNFATKWNLALAAGLALPLLQLAGYGPGIRTPEALSALTLAYCVLPCLFKLAAAALLSTTLARRGAFP